MKWVIAIILVSGCATVDPMRPPDQRFEALQEKQLSRFERTVAGDIHTGRTDDWTALAKAWIDFANCEEIAPAPTLAPPVAFVYATVELESMRRQFRIVDAIARKTEVRGDTIGDALFATSFFERKADPSDPNIVTWPGGDERWGDEVPGSVAVESTCATLVQRVRESKDDDKPRTYDAWTARYFDAIDRALAAAQALPESQRTHAIALSTFRIGLEGTRLAGLMKRDAERAYRRLKRKTKVSDAQKNPIDPSTGLDPGLAVDKYREQMRAYAEKTEALVSHAETDLPEAERTALLIVRASLATEKGDNSEALALLKRSGVSQKDERSFWVARYLEVLLLSRTGQHGEIVARFDNKLPPNGSRYFAPYAYRTARALRLSGDDDRFIAVAKAAFRDKEYQSSPFLRALFFEALQALAEVPFDDRVTELLEEFGARGETYDRVEQLARVALDRGRPENARSAASWLLAKNSNNKDHARYYAIRALSAFLDDDATLFKKELNRVIYRNKNVLNAIPVNRRPLFFAHADAELARILQQTLPVMAEWGDGKRAHERRQKWLGIIVEAAQDFLRKDKQSLSRPALISVYRLASALLKEHPRGYAERIGKTETTPLILGTVQVTGSDLRPFEPTLDFRLKPDFSLTLVPNDGPITEWESFWAAENKEGDDA